MKWTPDLDEQLLQWISQEERRGHSLAAGFRSFAKRLQESSSLHVRAKSCEVRFYRLRKKKGIPVGHPVSAKRLSQREIEHRVDAAQQSLRLISTGLAAFKADSQVAEKMNLTERQVRYARETMLEGKSRRRSRTPPPASTVDRDDEDEMLDALANLVKYGSMVDGFNLTSFAKALAALARGVAARAALVDQAAKAKELATDNERLQRRVQDFQEVLEGAKRENSDLRKQNEDLRKHNEGLHEKWQQINALVVEYENMDPADRLGKSKRLVQLLRYHVDQSGMVVKTEKVLVADS